MLHPPPDLESPILDTSRNTKVGQKIGKIFNQGTGNDHYSDDGYSEIDCFSGTKTSYDAILFTVSGITNIVEQKFPNFRFFLKTLMQI